jgi:hypothetical protein
MHPSVERRCTAPLGRTESELDHHVGLRDRAHALMVWDLVLAVGRDREAYATSTLILAVIVTPVARGPLLWALMFRPGSTSFPTRLRSLWLTHTFG